jgi:peptidoglycan/xylan/chitin deacetylase (PgdA/CDA1 family)
VTPSCPSTIARCPVTISVNMDIESLDAPAAGNAGLFGRYSYGRYGLREGLWRLLNVFRDTGVQATFFVRADDAERHPGVIQTLLDEGHEIAAQGEVWSDTSPPQGNGDLSVLADARERLARITGTAPVGWRFGNGMLTPAALPELARLGYRYDSSFFDDDHPYLMGEADQRLVELPISDYLDDAVFYAGRHSPERVALVWQEEFDAIHDAGGYVHLRLHTRGNTGSARGVRAQVVADFLHRVAARPGTTFYRCDALAALWQAAHPMPEPFAH